MTRVEESCRFKDLCVDVVDLPAMTRFWSTTLGLRVAETRSHTVRLDGEVDEQRVWLNAVPEPRVVKNRVHLDVWAGEVEELIARGARIIDADRFRWVVLTDPEGGEFCAFPLPTGTPPTYRLKELAVDAVDPLTLARWWSDRFGTRWHQEGDAAGEYVWIEPASGLPWSIAFAAVPEPKRVKNRVHVDVWGDTAALVEAGATLRAPADPGRGWDVLADPEGNEFCVFRDPRWAR